MAEAEDVIVDAARESTVFVRKLWKKYHPPEAEPENVKLFNVQQTLDLLLTAVFGEPFRIRIAQAPARATVFSRLAQSNRYPRHTQALPATDDRDIWLPPDSGLRDYALARRWFRCMALQQAIRAHRGSASIATAIKRPLLHNVYLLLEAYSADYDLLKRLPGLSSDFKAHRMKTLQARPPLNRFCPGRQPLEQLLRRILSVEPDKPLPEIPFSTTPWQSLQQAKTLVQKFWSADEISALNYPGVLFKDCWTGDLRDAPGQAEELSLSAQNNQQNNKQRPDTARSARLQRRPEVREANEDEDDEQQPGIWMVHADHPHPHAEDPLGLQRPVDRDQQNEAEEYGEMLSELPSARLISSPGSPPEVLLGDDPPDPKSRLQSPDSVSSENRIDYPEWDYRCNSYRPNGAQVSLRQAREGSQQWVRETLTRYQFMLPEIRRRFAMLQAERTTLRKLVDGEEIDLEACLQSRTDMAAGLSPSDKVYQTRRPARRDMAISLLVDVSGSTDSWVAEQRRIIDVEREALLLVCLALDSLQERYQVQAFSGEGPAAVKIWNLKDFSEQNNAAISQRIAALEPQDYTRVGAAIRHTSDGLMQQTATHRLLLLLSDGKPNDVDQYSGRYGVEDARQAVVEARLQGINVFCLTVDRQAAAYLPRIFGANQFAMLSKPELLPMVLLDWMKRLLAH